MVELWDVYDEQGNKTGRLHERGKPMKAGDYHLVVHVWIMNSNGELLITKRLPGDGDIAGLWQTTGGCAVTGDDGLKSALKETLEETGIKLDPKNGQMFGRYTQHLNDEGGAIIDAYLFRQEIDIADVILHPEETCDAMWANKDKILQMIDDGVFIPKKFYPYLDEFFYFYDKPFWEIGYHDRTANTFSKGPSNDVAGFYQNFAPGSHILDVGCGEGRNSIFLAGQGYIVDAFDLSEAGINKAKYIAGEKELEINFFVCDLGEFIFEKEYDAILSHGVLHLPEKAVRDRFIEKAQEHTKPGGYHIIGIFTNRLPATPDNAPFTKSLFEVGELPAKYAGWDILVHEESTFEDSHPGGVFHEHAYEKIIARNMRDF